MAIAYDNDAVAAHILNGVSGAADRAGRAARIRADRDSRDAAAGARATCLIAGRWDLPPRKHRVGLRPDGDLGRRRGPGWAASFLAARPAPEANPLGRGSSGGVQSLLAMIIIGPITLVLGAPALGFAIAGI